MRVFLNAYHRGIRQLILSSEEIQRDLQTRRALYAYLRYKRRQYYWEALRDDVYAPLRADRFCSDLRLPRHILTIMSCQESYLLMNNGMR